MTSIATLGSHCSLQVLKGAKDEGFKTILVCEKKREKLYRRFQFIDELIIVEKFSDILTQEIQDKIEYYLLEFSETVLNKIGLNVSDIVSNQDIDYMAISYLERYQDYDISQNEDYSASYSNEGDIDAIFER